MNVVDTIPAVWVIESASIFENVAVLPLYIRLDKGVVPPITPDVISPWLAINVKSWVPSTVSEKVIPPIPVPVFKITSPARETLDPKLIFFPIY